MMTWNHKNEIHEVNTELAAFSIWQGLLPERNDHSAIESTLLPQLRCKRAD